MSKRVIAVGTIIVVAVVAVVAWGVTRPAPSAPRGSAAPLTGHRAPDFTLPDVAGRRVSLSDGRGKVAMVNFWATWCVPCRTEMPLISRLSRTYRRVLFVAAVDKEEPASAVDGFVRQYHLALAPLLDSDGSISLRYHVQVQPTTFWLDGRGIIRAIHYGAMDRKYARREIAKLAG